MTSPLKDKYATCGVGYSPQGRLPGKTALVFHLEASANAIRDAGLNKDDIDEKTTLPKIQADPEGWISIFLSPVIPLLFLPFWLI